MDTIDSIENETHRDGIIALNQMRAVFGGNYVDQSSDTIEPLRNNSGVTPEAKLAATATVGLEEGKGR